MPEHLDVVVSIALSSHRVASFERVLRTVIEQSLKPTSVFVWFSDHPYLLDDGIEEADLPSSLVRFASESAIDVEFRSTNNIGPHRKLLPLLRQVRHETRPPLIVTADDDTLYPHRWLEALVAGHEESKCASAFRARRARLAPSPDWDYEAWPLVDPFDEVESRRLFITGREGMAVLPNMFDARIYDPSFADLCPSRSDAWIAAALMANETRVVKLSKARVLPDASGLRLTAIGDFPAARTDPPHNELWIFNKTRNSATLRRTFAFFEGDTHHP